MPFAETSAEPGGDEPRFSVVMPAFNSARTVGSAVASVLSQTEPRFELIVVDDGSTDTTLEVVQEIGDPRVRAMSQENRGLSAARNAGIALARAAYVSFLDSDDLWLPTYLGAVAHAIDAAGDVGFAYTDAYAFSPEKGRVRRGSAMYGGNPPAAPPADAAGFLLELLQRNFVWVSTTVPKSVLDELGGFDESRTASEDYDMWLRILVRGYRAVHVPGRHGLYRIHAGQMSRDWANLKRNQLGVYDGLRVEDLPTDDHRELLLRRRRETESDLSAAEGRAPLAAFTTLLRSRLGRTRQSLGLGGYAWVDRMPSDVAAAFPDLRRV